MSYPLFPFQNIYCKINTMEKLAKFRRWIISFFLVPFFTGAQVTLLPTSVFMTETPGVESLNIYNNTGAGQEVRISFAFAWLGNDEEGRLQMIEDSAEIAGSYDISGRIRAFPRTFVLPPQGQQTVRLQVLPLRDRPDGVYWTRVIVTSRAAAADIEKVDWGDGIGTRISYVFRQNIPVFYRKGVAHTGLQVLDVRTITEDGKLVALTRLNPTGNAPYNGSVTARLCNPVGEVVAEQRTACVVYFDALRRIELSLPADGLPYGLYTLELLYETKRRDALPGDLVQAPPVKVFREVMLGAGTGEGTGEEEGGSGRRQ